MNHAGSDVDLFQCYVAPTRDILRGENRGGGCHFTQDKAKDPPEDLQNHEIGKWIDMLIKGNVNYYWGVFSPLVQEARIAPSGMFEPDRTFLSYLRGIVRGQPTKAIYHSTKGLAMSNMKDVQTDERWHDPRWRRKKLNIIYRTVKFADGWKKMA
jgi:predicted nucleotidyltransferase